MDQLIPEVSIPALPINNWKFVQVYILEVFILCATGHYSIDQVSAHLEVSHLKLSYQPGQPQHIWYYCGFGLTCTRCSLRENDLCSLIYSSFVDHIWIINLTILGDPGTTKRNAAILWAKVCFMS